MIPKVEHFPVIIIKYDTPQPIYNIISFDDIVWTRIPINKKIGVENYSGCLLHRNPDINHKLYTPKKNWTEIVDHIVSFITNYNIKQLYLQLLQEKIKNPFIIGDYCDSDILKSDCGQKCVKEQKVFDPRLRENTFLGKIKFVIIVSPRIYHRIYSSDGILFVSAYQFQHVAARP